MIECFGISLSIEELTSLMSRPEVAERQELFLSLSPEWCFNSHQKHSASNSSLSAELCCRAESVGGGFNRLSQAAPQTYAVTDASEFFNTNRLFARVVLQQIRPRNPLAVNLGGAGGDPESRSRLPGRCRQRDTIAQMASPDPLPAPIETLFAELACRRLHSFTTRKR
jgi:hypothetical protein